jgi:hypothetical protein
VISLWNSPMSLSVRLYKYFLSIGYRKGFCVSIINRGNGFIECRKLHADFYNPISIILSSWRIVLCDAMRAVLAVGILVVSVLFGLDILTTTLALSCGASELNVFMAGIVDQPAVHTAVKGMVLLFIALTTSFLETRIEGSGLYLLAVIIGFYAFTIAHNISIILPLANGLI